MLIPAKLKILFKKLLVGMTIRKINKFRNYPWWPCSKNLTTKTTVISHWSSWLKEIPDFSYSHTLKGGKNPWNYLIIRPTDSILFYTGFNKNNWGWSPKVMYSLPKRCFYTGLLASPSPALFINFWNWFVIPFHIVNVSMLGFE